MRTVMMMAAVMAMAAGLASAAVVDFSEFTVGASGRWNGSDLSGGFTSGGATFVNNYNTSYNSWNGFAYSNINDTTTKGFLNQYAAYTGTGMGGSGIYAIGYVATDFMSGEQIPSQVVLSAPSRLGTVGITNATYAALSMRDGDQFAKKFGGVDGTDPDWFKLTITGKDAQNAVTGSVDFYLADYRTDNDYIVNTWQLVDLGSLGVVKSLEFTVSSTDNGDYGIRTPSYFALDNLAVVPEPATIGLLVLGAGALLRRRK